MKKVLVLVSAVLVALAFQYIPRAQGINDETGIERSVKKMQAQFGKTGKETGLPSGAIVIWPSGDTCPEGFSRVSMLDGFFIKGASAEKAAGIKGGSSVHTHRGTVDISHEHTFQGETDRPSYSSFVKSGNEYRNVAEERHTHRFSGRTDRMGYFDARKSFETELASSEPPYVTVLFCQKN